ncbi:hypothetical protein GPECTOR_4g978 [Gonium pectorale]|uniref:phytol kinase n=1 Tax=Gonium pectorale TaxID=33097 RepID=A0A150GYB2_GONPE|nr:hypothetical protein GPECTOR_4g978 [Gonium pectorale]|eukprot:KXZ54906.1 hypothetical protein GPECTOR_4g978 [Gonium pectorale]
MLQLLAFSIRLQEVAGPTDDVRQRHLKITHTIVLVLHSVILWHISNPRKTLAGTQLMRSMGCTLLHMDTLSCFSRLLAEAAGEGLAAPNVPMAALSGVASADVVACDDPSGSGHAGPNSNGARTDSYLKIVQVASELMDNWPTCLDSDSAGTAALCPQASTGTPFGTCVQYVILTQAVASLAAAGGGVDVGEVTAAAAASDAAGALDLPVPTGFVPINVLRDTFLALLRIPAEAWPDVLPPQPSAALATALSAGLVPAMEATLRRTAAAGDLQTAGLGLLHGLLQVEVVAGSQPQKAPAASPRHKRFAQQLLAFGPQRQVAALVVTLGKLLHRCVDAVEALEPACGAAGTAASSGGGVAGGTSSAQHAVMWSVVGVLMDALPSAADLLRAALAPETGGGAGAAAQLQQQASLALHRWLPAVARAARVQRWDPVTQIATRLARVDMLNWLLILLRAPTLPHSDTAAEAAAWQRLLLCDVDVLGLLGNLLSTSLHHPRACDGTGCQTHRELLLIADCLRAAALAFPAAMGAVLLGRKPPSRRRDGGDGGAAGSSSSDALLPASSPWSSASLVRFARMSPCALADVELRMYLTTMVSGLEGFRFSTSLQIADGPDLATMFQPAAMAGDGGPRCAALSNVTAATHAAFGVLSPSALEAAAGALRVCSHPACINLAGRSEAVLQDEEALSKCGGCGCAWYCGRGCQVAHWRAGHKAECAAGRREQAGGS